MNAAALDQALPEDTPHRAFLVRGAREGFDLGIPSHILAPVELHSAPLRNFPSASAHPTKLREFIHSELALGRLLTLPPPAPAPTARVALVPKGNGDIRFIADHTMEGRGLNSLVDWSTLPAILLPTWHS